MNCDYERFRNDFERMDHLIECSYLDAMAVDFALENLGTQASERERHNRREFAPVALRMEVLRHLLGLPSFRSLSRSLACSDLLADFRRI